MARVFVAVLLRFAHILLAIVAIGANLTYALWLRIGERHPEHLAYTIRGIRAIDRHVANPAYGLLLVTGLAFGPVVRRELAALERDGVDDPEYLRCRGLARRLGILTTTVVLTILALMVTKPF
ncbi:MAG: hypothetical protein ACYC9W_04165 [Candidatus Limnocylindria bacterium]